MRHYILGVLLLLAQHVQAAECPRIISQSPYITHSLQWLGLEKCIVGVSRYDTLNRPHTGGILDPDTKAIDDLMADVIFTANWITDKDMAKATPKGMKYYRLDGFNSMAEIENNLHTIGKVVKIKNIKQKVASFKKEVSKQTKAINGKNKKALLLSSCSGNPYSFGKQTWLYDLFTQMNFKMVESHNKIRHLKPGNEIEEITTLLNTFEPDILFIFERKLNSRCNLILPKVPVKIVPLDGKVFLHPAPTLLKGLAELERKWSLF
ncbi:MAG: ABC transporter substrate-binding protein [Gammaproteobacteria bacterium]|nr:ABC transporter substrate-binding protein [Gammaproteobacteria bacterium]MDH5777950.1 ABC transporter substrate-binding protein [Gammaproteobacteria bacterium]